MITILQWLIYELIKGVLQCCLLISWLHFVCPWIWIEINHFKSLKTICVNIIKLVTASHSIYFCGVNNYVLPFGYSIERGPITVIISSTKLCVTSLIFCNLMINAFVTHCFCCLLWPCQPLLVFWCSFNYLFLCHFNYVENAMLLSFNMFVYKPNICVKLISCESLKLE